MADGNAGAARPSPARNDSRLTRHPSTFRAPTCANGRTIRFLSAIPALVCFVIAILHVVLVLGSRLLRQSVVGASFDGPLIKYTFSSAASLPNSRRPAARTDRERINRQINQERIFVEAEANNLKLIKSVDCGTNIMAFAMFLSIHLALYLPLARVDE